MSDTFPDGEFIYSDLAADRDMVELVEMFLHELPTRIDQMQNALRDKDLSAIARVAHQLKGAAGGYGYQVITEDAGAIESLARQQADIPRLTSEIDALSALCRRARVAPDTAAAHPVA